MEFSRAGRKMLNIVDGYAMVTQVFGRRRQPRGRKEGRKLMVKGTRREILPTDDCLHVSQPIRWPGCNECFVASVKRRSAQK